MRSRTIPVPAPSSKSSPPSRSEGTLVRRAYEALRESITSGNLAPGSRVVERALARRLGMSPTPVRAALHRLGQQGYLVTVPAGLVPRVVMAPLRRDDMAELYFLIGDLEGWAALRCAEAPPRERRALADRSAEINRSLAALAGKRPFDQARCHDLDADWHRAIVGVGAGPRLANLLGTIKPQAERYDRMYVAAVGDSVTVSVAEHQAVERAVRRGDGPLARAAMMANWTNSAERLGRIIEARGEVGPSW